MKLRDYMAIALLIIVAIGGRVYSDGSENPENPRRPDPRLIDQPDLNRPPPDTVRSPGRELPRATGRDPRFIVELEEKQQNSVGTAFSVARDGVWVTARHVTDGCDLVGLQKSNGQLVRARRIAEQPGTDISILWTRGGTPPMRVVTPRLRIGDDGYSFGFPKGDPGDVHGRVLGRARMMARGRYRTNEPGIAWTQISRVPDRGAHLGGISGGPWVDAKGDVIGVHVAGSPRRGRSYSTAPSSLTAALKSVRTRSGNSGSSSYPVADLTPGRFNRYGNALRRDLTVAKVICLVGEKWRRQAAQQRS